MKQKINLYLIFIVLLTCSIEFIPNPMGKNVGKKTSEYDIGNKTNNNLVERNTTPHDGLVPISIEATETAKRGEFAKSKSTAQPEQAPLQRQNGESQFKETSLESGGISIPIFQESSTPTNVISINEQSKGLDFSNESQPQQNAHQGIPIFPENSITTEPQAPSKTIDFQNKRTPMQAAKNKTANIFRSENKYTTTDSDGTTRIVTYDKNTKEILSTRLEKPNGDYTETNNQNQVTAKYSSKDGIVEENITYKSNGKDIASSDVYQVGTLGKTFVERRIYETKGINYDGKSYVAYSSSKTIPENKIRTYTVKGDIKTTDKFDKNIGYKVSSEIEFNNGKKSISYKKNGTSTNSASLKANSGEQANINADGSITLKKGDKEITLPAQKGKGPFSIEHPDEFSVAVAYNDGTTIKVSISQKDGKLLIEENRITKDNNIAKPIRFFEPDNSITISRFNDHSVIFKNGQVQFKQAGSKKALYFDMLTGQISDQPSKNIVEQIITTDAQGQQNIIGLGKDGKTPLWKAVMTSDNSVPVKVFKADSKGIFSEKPISEIQNLENGNNILAAMTNPRKEGFVTQKRAFLRINKAGEMVGRQYNEKSQIIYEKSLSEQNNQTGQPSNQAQPKIIESTYVQDWINNQNTFSGQRDQQAPKDSVDSDTPSWLSEEGKNSSNSEKQQEPTSKTELLQDQSPEFQNQVEARRRAMLKKQHPLNPKYW